MDRATPCLRCWNLFKNGDSAVTTHWLFCRHFNIPCHGCVPCHNTIKECVQNFRENASALERKPWGRIPTEQDGTTAHTARASLSVLREMFPQHVISCGGNVPWPARSPDLSVGDYFLWVYLKSRIFISKPRTIAELKQSIKVEIVGIMEQMTHRVMENLGVRLKQCLRKGGRHLNDILFKT